MSKTNKMPKDCSPDSAGTERELRWGFTTGSAATAAALAAAKLLLGQPLAKTIKLRLPSGQDYEIPIFQGGLNNTDTLKQADADESWASVIKDAGDDPDITNGAEIGVIARRLSKKNSIEIIGGSGVGKVSKAGLAVEPGKWAINPGPTAMLMGNLTPLVGSKKLPGLEVEIYVKNGEKLAAQTLNPRLGIIGGISILGTTGLVKPFSHKAYLDTIESSLNQLAVLGHKEVVLTTGRQSEKLIMALKPQLPEECFIQIADFFGASLQLSAEKKLTKIGLAVFFGKAVKQAAGHFYTHAHHNDQDISALIQWLDSGLDEKTKNNLASAITARGALEILRHADKMALLDLVLEKALESARKFAGPNIELWISLFDYDGSLLSHKTLK